MALQLCSSSSSLLSLCSLQLLRLSPIASPSDQFLKPTIMPQGILKKKKQKHSLLFCRSSNDESNEDYYLDAPVSVGDGFSFSGGKYSDEPSPADEWFEQGKIVKAHPVGGTGDKAKDPIFGLAMGGGSQTSSDLFRWFCVDSGSADNHPIVLIHGFPSQAYSYRKVLPILSKKYHAIAFDWLGFGFSDKPQPRYGFDYTLDEYTSSLESIIDETTKGKATLVVQGYFSPVVVKYASSRQEKITDLILLNPPVSHEFLFLLSKAHSQACQSPVHIIHIQQLSVGGNFFSGSSKSQ
ncbi:uncharacterized protein LOC113759548 isoform X3 [Coffea eugenioides]|uniref:uncharacterized protein LOC113759548 isoform X3 n=1 Tax=Coffea eugenioides TaxID=49369 RepID=UPI000F6127F0|nr:uncharacterized protein LOC113759548 isoform X3 [Coffea eugenioides]